MPTNINDATYFELRLVEDVCTNRSVHFKFVSDLERYIELIDASHGENAEKKKEIQEIRIASGIEVFLKNLEDKEKLHDQKLIDVNWVGRQDIGSRVADVDLVLDGGKVLPISTKSGGPGTERNLGGESLRAILGYDSDPILEEMKDETLALLQKNFPKIDFGTSWDNIRGAIRSSSSSSKMRSLAKQVGKKFQVLISEELIDAWARASGEQKFSVLKYLALQNDPRDEGLQVFVAEDQRAYFKELLVISKLRNSDIELTKHQSSSNGTLEVLIDKRRHWRLNVNFTNGIGLSPIAIRVFLI